MTLLDSATGRVSTVLRRRGLRQFVKFCIVGVSSTAIDFSVFFILIELVHIQQYLNSVDLGRGLAVFVAFIVAVTNGFYWNSRWTFASTDREGLHQRYLKFVFTNVIGLLLNLSITLTLARVAPAAVVLFLSPVLSKDPAAFFGKAVATLIVVFWNFTASKYWTFRS